VANQISFAQPVILSKLIVIKNAHKKTAIVSHNDGQFNKFQ